MSICRKSQCRQVGMSKVKMSKTDRKKIVNSNVTKCHTYMRINVKKLPQKFDIFVRVEMTHLKWQKLLC